MATEEPITSFPMDKEAAEEEIALLVRKPGFDDLTVADIIRHMNNRFNTNFDSYKSQLKEMVIEEIKKRNQEKDSSDESGSDSDNDSDHEKEKKKKLKTEIPEEKEKVVKKEVKEEVEETKPEKPQKQKKSAKEDDSDSDSGVDDAVIKKSSKNSAPRVQSDMATTIKSSRRAAASDALKQIRYTSGGGRYANSKKNKVKDPNADNSGKFGPMTKLCYISTELQQITKDQWMKRCDVVKVLWDYIKEKNLKDPKNGQFILCDDVLKSIFNKNRIKGFGMTKFLTKHIIGTSDMVPDMREEAEAEMDKRRKEWKERQRKREAEAREESAISDDSDGPSVKKPKAEEPEEDADDDSDDEKDGKNNDGSSSSDSD